VGTGDVDGGGVGGGPRREGRHDGGDGGYRSNTEIIQLVPHGGDAPTPLVGRGKILHIGAVRLELVDPRPVLGAAQQKGVEDVGELVPRHPGVVGSLHPAPVSPTGVVPGSVGDLFVKLAAGGVEVFDSVVVAPVTDPSLSGDGVAAGGREVKGLERGTVVNDHFARRCVHRLLPVTPLVITQIDLTVGRGADGVAISIGVGPGVAPAGNRLRLQRLHPVVGGAAPAGRHLSQALDVALHAEGLVEPDVALALAGALAPATARIPGGRTGAAALDVDRTPGPVGLNTARGDLVVGGEDGFVALVLLRAPVGPVLAHPDPVGVAVGRHHVGRMEGWVGQRLGIGLFVTDGLTPLGRGEFRQDQLLLLGGQVPDGGFDRRKLGGGGGELALGRSETGLVLRPERRQLVAQLFRGRPVALENDHLAGELGNPLAQALETLIVVLELVGRSLQIISREDYLDGGDPVLLVELADQRIPVGLPARQLVLLLIEVLLDGGQLLFGGGKLTGNLGEGEGGGGDIAGELLLALLQIGELLLLFVELGGDVLQRLLRSGRRDQTCGERS